MIQDKGYLDFDEYIRQGEPSKREAAYAWSTAIGLQAVDGLKTSAYLNELARRNIEGEITMDEVSKLLDTYYESKAVREPDDDGKEEADHGVATEDVVKHLTGFVAGLWQIHPFPEGNTRTTAVFTILYLRSIGFNVENDLFAKNSWYFRNALVRANYKNAEKGIDYSPVYLERFFRNLLLGEQWDLRNRYLHIHALKEWSVQPNLATPTTTGQVPDKLGTSTRTTTQTTTRTSTRTNSIVSGLNSNSKFYTDNDIIIELVRVVGNDELSVKQMMELLGLKHRQNFLEYHLEPALREKFIRRKFPDNPNHPRQRYLLTMKGLALFNELINLDN